MVGLLYKNFKDRLLEKILKCRHDQITCTNKTTFCPDCGVKVNIKWLIAECSDCKTHRPTKLVFGKPFSFSKKCPCCSSSKYRIIKVNYLNDTNADRYVIVKSELPSFIEHLEKKSGSRSFQASNLKSVKNRLSYKGLYKLDAELLKL